MEAGIEGYFNALFNSNTRNSTEYVRDLISCFEGDGLSPVSPVCFWHRENSGLSISEPALTAAEIIMEYSAVSFQPNSFVDVAARESLNDCPYFPGLKELIDNQMSDFSSQHFSGNSVPYPSCLKLQTTALNSKNDRTLLIKLMSDKNPSAIFQPVKDATSAAIPCTLTPTSTPTPLNKTTESALVTNIFRKVKCTRSLEAGTSTRFTEKFKPKTVNKLFYGCYVNKGSGSEGNANHGNVNNTTDYEKATLTAKITSIPVAEEGHMSMNNKQQSQLVIQQQLQSKYIGSNTNKVDPDLDGVHFVSNNESTSNLAAAVAVMALKERVFTEIIHARFNALTAAAVVKRAVSMSPTVLPSNTTDEPYDLSVNKKIFNTNLDSKVVAPNLQGSSCKDNLTDKKKQHIKKPLNAFMLYMKEMRAKVVAECTLKESAAINQILGRRWHALGREEQAKYYELARRERQLHMQMYPDWSSRTNTSRGKKRKRKQDSINAGGGG